VRWLTRPGQGVSYGGRSIDLTQATRSTSCFPLAVSRVSLRLLHLSKDPMYVVQPRRPRLGTNSTPPGHGCGGLLMSARQLWALCFPISSRGFSAFRRLVVEVVGFRRRLVPVREAQTGTGQHWPDRQIWGRSRGPSGKVDTRGGTALRNQGDLFLGFLEGDIVGEVATGRLSMILDIVRGVKRTLATCLAPHLGVTPTGTHLESGP